MQINMQTNIKGKIQIKGKRIVSCLMAAVFCFLSVSHMTVYAAGKWPEGPEIEGGNAIVMEVDSGSILYEKNPHEQLYPASITKILTALLTIENCKMEETVTFSYDSVHKTEGSGIWRDVDEIMTVEQCLYALMLNSANECAYALAEHTGKSYEDFVTMMNERAKALGCENTHFNNPHGLTEEEHYTSCYDMALIAREAVQNETFRQIIATKRYEIPPTNKHPDEITYLKNHQKMLFEDEKYYYEYCIGGKTGYTMAAGNSLVTFAKKDEMTLVCVVMNSNPTAQYEDSIALLNYCFDNFRSYNVAENMSQEFQTQVSEHDFLSGEAFVDIDKDAKIILPADVKFSDVEMKVVTDFENRNIVGSLQYTYDGRIVGNVDIKVTDKNIKPYPFHEQKEKEDTEEKKVIEIDVRIVVLAIIGIIILAAAGFGIYKLGDNFYLLRYKFFSRRKKFSDKKLFKRKWWKKGD